MKRPRTPPAAPGMVDYPSTDHEQLMKRLRSAQSVEEVIFSTFLSNFLFWVLDFCISASKPYLVITSGIPFCYFNFQVTYPTTRHQAPWSLEDLPRAVAVTLPQGSTVTSMDFHPSHHTLLLGTIILSWPFLQLIANFVTKRLLFNLFI